MTGFVQPIPTKSQILPCDSSSPPRSPRKNDLAAPGGHSRGCAAGSLASLWSRYENFISDRNRAWPTDRQRWTQFIAPRLGHLKPHEVRRADIYALLDSMEGYAPASKQRVLALIRRFMNWLIEMDVFPGPNPATRVKLFVDNVRTRVLTDDERERLIKGLESAPVRLRLIVLALLWTGKRRGELRSLLWSDVDLERGLLRLRSTNTKAKRTQTIPLNSKAQAVFEEAARLRISDFVFPAPSGILYWELGKHWEDFRVTVGLEGVWLHDLRRDAISRWARAGVSPLVIQRLSGHSTLGMVMRYTQLAPEDVRGAAETLCIDS